MASNFEVSVQRDGGTRYVRMSGDFDEASARRLIESLEKDCRDAAVVFIQAGGLDHLHPSGCEAFRNNLHALKDFCYRLVFADAQATRMSPDWLQYF
jgi:hypothetical protein